MPSIAQLEKNHGKVQDKAVKAILNNLAELGGSLAAADDVTFEGEKLIIPRSMNIKQTISFLEKKLLDEETETAFHRRFHFRQWDGANAVDAAFRRAFGSLRQTSTPMGFWGDSPPHMISVNIGVDEIKQVPWGSVVVPHLPGVRIVLDSWHHPEFGDLFEMHAVGPKKYKNHIEGLFKLVEEELKRNSIYRGKAIDGQGNPEFLDLKGVDPKKVVYSDEVMTQLTANVWALLRHPEIMESLGMNLKRAVLLFGPYGTGKSLAAFLTAQEAVRHGWTFVYVRPGRDNLVTCMQTARLYQPAVVFFEDVDTITATDNGNNDTVTQLLDIFDGITAKGTKILSMMTTNHVEKIHKGMVRPGRLDAVIEIGALDVHGVERMIQACVPAEKIAEELDYLSIYNAMEGFLPAFVKEAIERTMRYAIARTGKVEGLVTSDFMEAAQGLRPQLDLMNANGTPKQLTIEDLISKRQFKDLKELEMVCANCEYEGAPHKLVLP